MTKIIYYFIFDNQFINNGKNNMTRTGRLQRITKEYAINHKILVPSLKIQKEKSHIESYKDLIKINTKQSNKKSTRYGKSTK